MGICSTCDINDDWSIWTASPKSENMYVNINCDFLLLSLMTTKFGRVILFTSKREQYVSIVFKDHHEDNENTGQKIYFSIL